jgi:hypothetical protein
MGDGESVRENGIRGLISVMESPTVWTTSGWMRRIGCEGVISKGAMTKP